MNMVDIMTNEIQCAECDGTEYRSELAALVTGQVGGPTEMSELLICRACGHVITVVGADEDAP